MALTSKDRPEFAMAARSVPTTSMVRTECCKPLGFPTYKRLILFDSVRKADIVPYSSKRKIGFVDQILDYIEGGPKLRKWYGAPELISPDDSRTGEDDDNDVSEEERNAVLITDGDCEIGQMIILSLVVKRVRVKAFVKDKRSAMEAFGTYVELISGDLKSQKLVTKALRGVRAIIFPREGFLSNVGNLNGVKHAILLSQLSAYRGSGGLQAIMNTNAKKLAEQDEAMLATMGIPYTIIRTGTLQNSPSGTQGFSFEKRCAEKGSLSKEDSALICIEALNVVPEEGYVFEVVNGDEMVSDWKARLTKLMENRD